MLFNSLQFLIFFVIVTTLYFILPHKWRWLLLLIASCYFYMAFVPIYILILFFTIVIDYVAGIAIENAKGKKRKLLLIISLASNIGVLAVFKYYNFFNTNLTEILSQFSLKNPIPALKILLPIGLSFHTFQAMSYTIEVYRKNQKAIRHFGIYSLYVMFYPQLVAGPIERPQNLLHQFETPHKFDYKEFVAGLQLMLWGFFKKVVIADRLAIAVDHVYNEPQQHQGITLIIATLFFTFQIYCDFSGYSDIAIGSARVMGFKLMKNFDAPYFSTSISEFWKRWHISLSTWFKDYLYITLGGNRVSIPRWYFNLFIVFMVSGFWHGANFTYIIWGALHGIYLIFAIIKDNLIKNTFLEKTPTFIQITTTFLLCTYGWIFFRAKNLTDAWYIITNFTKGWNNNSLYIGKTANQNFFGLSISKYEFFSSILLIIFLQIVDYFTHQKGIEYHLQSQKTSVRWAIYYILTTLILLYGVYYTSSQFIYFQF